MKYKIIILLALLSGFYSCEKDNLNDEETIDFTTQLAPTSSNYNLDQAMSDNAQLTTIAFSGLAFITGNSGSDSFFPPGKVADFFGLQYMRDIDIAGYGHNTQFLSRAANNVLNILNDEQKSKMIALAKEQASIYVKYAYNRFPLMSAFRRNLEGNIPSGSSGLLLDKVVAYSASMYKLDADLSYNRAIMMGEIVQSLTSDQKTGLGAMSFNNFDSWPDIPEDTELKKNLTNNEFVAVMTYASEFLSWYKGGINADVYFCPERHGTYFGGFFLKDYPAMNNPNYFIPTNLTGESGKAFLDALTPEQKSLISSIITEQKEILAEIADIRQSVSLELRKAMNGQTVDKDKVYSLIQRYGELDGNLSGLYALRFAEVKKTLSAEQMETLTAIRNLDVIPEGSYRFSSAVATPELPDIDYLFGIGTVPDDAGNYTPPAAFGS